MFATFGRNAEEQKGFVLCRDPHEHFSMPTLLFYVSTVLRVLPSPPPMQGKGANLIVDSDDDGKLVKVISIRGYSLCTNDQVPVNAS